MKNVIIYTLADPSSLEIKYIGKTVSKLKVRLYNHILDINRRNNKRSAWIKSLLKKDLKPVIEELEECSWDESNSLEIFYISLFKSWGFRLVNSTNGGEGNLGFSMTKESRNKISLKIKDRYSGNKNPFYGKKHTTETKNLISEIHKGKKKSVEFCNQRSQYQKSINWKPTKNMEQNMIKAHGRRVVQIDIDGKEIREFYTIKDAADKLGLEAAKITMCCQGKRKTTKGTRWKYKQNI